MKFQGLEMTHTHKSQTRILAGSAGERTVENTRRLMQVDRRTLSPERRVALESEFDQLWSFFSHLSGRWKKIVQDTRLAHPQLKSLNETGAGALSFSKLIYTELDAFTSNHRSIVSPGLLADLLRENERQLKELESQFALLTNLEEYAQDLHSIIDELFHARRISSVRLENLADRILHDVRTENETARAEQGLLTLTIPGFSLPDYLQLEGSQSDAWVCAVGVQAARMTAAIVREDSSLYQRVRLLTMAALVQDVGFHCLEQQHCCTPQSLLVENETIFHQHPVMGAGLVSAVNGFPYELPYLVSTHHERLDQTGYPRLPEKLELTSPARMMAIVSRFVELINTGLDDPSRTESNEQAASRVRTAALQIRRDAARGKFDADLANHLLNALEIQPISLQNMESLSAEEDQFTHFSGKNLRIDQTHTTPSADALNVTRESSAGLRDPRLRENDWREEVARFPNY